MATKGNAWVDFVSRYHGDQSFANEANRNPADALRKCGMDVPQGKSVKLMKNTESTWHYVVPSSPISDLSQGELAGTSAGACGDQCDGGSCHCNTE